MKNKRVPRTLAVILSLTLLITAAGCQKKQEAKPMKQQSSQSQQSVKPPESVKTMLKEIDKVLKALDQKAQQQKLPQIKVQAAEKAASQQPKGQSTSGGNQGGNQMGTNQKSQQQGSNQQQQGQQQQVQPAKIPSTQDWQPETQSLKKLHQEWNTLEPEAVKAGMTSEDRQKFETALDNLTRAITNKDVSQSGKSAAQVYLEFGRVLSYFKYPLPQDYFQVKYLVMTTMAAAFAGDWTAAAADMQSIEEPWSRLQTQADKKQKTEIDRTEHSIQDLAQAVAQKDLSLTYIKSEIVLENLKKIEEKLTKEQGGNQQQ